MLNAAKIVSDEIDRRAELRAAIAEVVEFAGLTDEVSIGALHRHLAKYYGPELAEGATRAELIGGAAAAAAAGRGWVDGDRITGVRLRKPSRAELRRIAAQWNKGLPQAEVPAIRRPHGLGGYGVDGKGDTEYHELPPPGSLYRVDGIYRQSPDPATLHAWRDGGNGHRGGVTIKRARRFPSYVARLRAFLDGPAVISSVDREILEHVIEGRTLQWIADEMAMKKPTVHKRVNKIRTRAGIAGPGRGR